MPPGNSNPLGEVFGFPTDNVTSLAQKHRSERLCPFQGAACTKGKREDPLGVCSDKTANEYRLRLVEGKTRFTEFNATLEAIVTPPPINLAAFQRRLEDAMKKRAARAK